MKKIGIFKHRKQTTPDDLRLYRMFVYLEHLWSHEVVVADQRDNLVGEDKYDLAEQDGHVHAPCDAVEVYGVFVFLFDRNSGPFAALVLVFFVTVCESVVEQQRQYNVEHHKQRVGIPRVPRILEHDEHVVV